MLEIDYNTGFNLARNIAICIALIQFIWFIYPFFLLVYRDYRIMTFYFPFLSGVGIFAVLYPLFNTLGQYQVFYDSIFVKKIHTDLILLRVSSILIGFSILMNGFKVIYRTGLLLSFTRLEKKEQGKINHPEELKLLHGESRNFSQLSIYLMTIFTLQAISINQPHFILLMTITNTVLFFIIDDWEIINEYSIVTKGVILKKHEIKILITNAILFISSITLLWLNVSFVWAGLMTIPFVYSIYWRYFSPLKKQ